MAAECARERERADQEEKDKRNLWPGGLIGKAISQWLLKTEKGTLLKKERERLKSPLVTTHVC